MCVSICRPKHEMLSCDKKPDGRARIVASVAHAKVTRVHLIVYTIRKPWD